MQGENDEINANLAEIDEAAQDAEKDKPQAAQDETFVMKRSTLNYLLIGGACLFVGLFIGLQIGSQNSGLTLNLISTAVVQGINSSNLGQNLAAPSPAPIVDVSADDDPAWGPEDAPVLMIEFSDFQCPYCGRFHQETYPLIRENYGDRIRFVYRDFPLSSIHPDAFLAAQAADCANEQGDFWAYHDLLFSNQEDLSRTALDGFAVQLGLDTEVFGQCLDVGRYEQEVIRDAQDAQTYGIQGTPTFFINGRPIVGAQPYTVFQAIIEEELAKAGS
jgi:protein-disulfide isomerase